MRPITFRAWDNVDKVMRDVAMLRWENGEMTRIAGYWTNTRDNGWTDAHPDSGRYELMQFTGCIDRNGTEVYEGDIMKDQFGEVWLVYFKNGRLKSPDPELSEVIGNLFENPELIKK